VQDGEFGADLGRFDLHFRRDPSGRYRLASYQYRLLPIDPGIPEDPAVNRVLAPYLKPMMVVVGTIAAPGLNADDRTRRSTQVVARAIRDAAGAEVALEPLGGDFFETFRRPVVTKYDVFAVLPFEDDIATADLTGTELKALLTAEPTTVAAGLPAHLDAEHTYRVGFIGYEAESDYHIAAAKLHDTHIDVRDGVIRYLQRGGH
ncbi:MAG: 5'-nucleotidase C-terminal domain-containing protein, partial [Chloroflexi bacterium]|nr:5'-nucleotidase C-terminal domain-containing protein [Chloroflexota bacterium]